MFLFRFQLPDFIAQFHHFAHIFKIAVRQLLDLCLVIFLGLHTFLLLLFQIRNLRSRLVPFGFQHVKLFGQRFHLGRPLLDLFLQLHVAFCNIALLPDALLNTFVQHGVFALDSFQRLFFFCNAGLDVGHLVVQRVQLLLQFGQERFLPAHFRAFFQKDAVTVLLLLLQFGPGLLYGFHPLHELGQLAEPQFPVQFVVAHGSLRLDPQRLHPAFHFALDVVDAGQVVGRIVQTARGFLLPHTEPGDACRFLKDGAPVFRTAVQDFVDFVLPDEEHGAFAHARIRQQVQYIF